MNELIAAAIVCISLCIVIIIGIYCYINSQIQELKQQITSLYEDIKKYNNINERFNFADALRNIEELIDPKPNDCYIDKMCYDVAHYCICQPTEKIIITDTIMRHFCIGYKRASTILHQLVLRNICKRLQCGGVVAIITIEQLNQMAREGKI